MPSSLTLRPIRPEDNLQVAAIIRAVMTDYGAVGPGFSIEDPEVDGMYEAYNHPRALFLVLENTTDGQVVGCGGIAPLQGGAPDTCELKKMYFLPAARGQGMGRRLVETLEVAAGRRGFRYMYIETLSSMQEANRLYQRLGFEPLPGPMGSTGHGGCNQFYGKALVLERILADDHL